MHAGRSVVLVAVALGSFALGAGLGGARPLLALQAKKAQPASSQPAPQATRNYIRFVERFTGEAPRGCNPLSVSIAASVGGDQNLVAAFVCQGQ